MKLGPIFRTVDIVMGLVLLAMITWTFKVKNDSEEALSRVAELERQLEEERIEIDLLKSDWALLTSPTRLQALVERYSNELGLVAAEPTQIINGDELPPLRTDFEPSNDKRNALGNGTDPTTQTGSISSGANQGGAQ